MGSKSTPKQYSSEEMETLICFSRARMVAIQTAIA